MKSDTPLHSPFLFIFMQEEVENLEILPLPKLNRKFSGRSSAKRCKRGGCARGRQKGKRKTRGFLSFGSREK